MENNKGRIPRKKKKKIPNGPYCYTYKKGKYVPCPFHGYNNKYPEQANGYCSLMKKGDWNLHEEAVVTDMKTGEIIDKDAVPFSFGLLWDQVKECGYKDYR